MPPAATHAALADGHRGTDAGNAERFVKAAGGRIRYVHKWSRWVVYQDGRWVLDTGDALVTEAARQLAAGMFKVAAAHDGQARDDLWKWARHSETASAIAAMIRLARGIDGVLVDHALLDANPWILNVRNGTVDLRTGHLRSHDPADLLTMQAPVDFDPSAVAPLWDRCLERWQPDGSVRDFLQRAAGSGVAGVPVERFFVSHGDGGNGKSKFFGAIAKVLGPYYAIPHKSLLVQQRHEQHDTVRADLFRTRLLVGAETDEGARLDEAKVKDLTGGEEIKGRRMREDLWAFSPSWSLFLHTNHRPRVRDTTESIWRRVRLIPWTVTIPERERDDALAEKLAAEASGILNWLIDGCIQWQRRGFDEPASITEATAAWRDEEDVVGRWLQDCTIPGSTLSAPAAALRESFEQWCHANGERALSAKALGSELKHRGYDSAQIDRRRTWLGLGLTTDQEEPHAA